MTTHRFGLWFAHLFLLAYCGVLLGGFLVQFGAGEFPCPLCLLQRMAMILCSLGPAYIIRRARDGEVSIAEYAAGYGISILGAVLGFLMSARQVLLHIVPPDPGYGSPVLGLHLYTWAMITFLIVFVAAGLNMIFAASLTPPEGAYNVVSTILLWIFMVLIAANVIVVFFEEGFHWTLPDNPDRYQLLYDLGILG